MERTKKESVVKKETTKKKAPEAKLEGKDLAVAVKVAAKAMGDLGIAMVPKRKWTGGIHCFRFTLQIVTSINLKFWSIIPALNLNLHSKMSTVEIEFLCFGLYFDFVR